MPPPREASNALAGPGDYDVTEHVHSDTYPAISPTKLDLAGKAAFVTGASRGIGKTAALSLACAGVSQLAIGARSDLSSLAPEIEGAAKQAGRQAPRILAVQLDLSDPSSVDAAAAEISDAFGKLDVVLNVGGVFGARSEVVDSDPDAWWQPWEVNVKGMYALCRSVIPLLSKGELKTICNVSSVGAHLVVPGLSSYQSSKFAMLRLAEFVSEEYKDDGVVCFTVHPGNVMTEMTKDVSEEIKHIFCDTMELAGDTMVWLTSERREWLAGRYINVTWDMLELEAKKDVIVKEDLLKMRLQLGSLVV